MKSDKNRYWDGKVRLFSIKTKKDTHRSITHMISFVEKEVTTLKA